MRHVGVREEVNARAQNENDIAAQIVGFMQQFLEVFAELKGKKFYVSGESVSCIIALVPSCLWADYGLTYSTRECMCHVRVAERCLLAHGR